MSDCPYCIVYGKNTHSPCPAVLEGGMTVAEILEDYESRKLHGIDCDDHGMQVKFLLEELSRAIGWLKKFSGREGRVVRPGIDKVWLRQTALLNDEADELDKFLEAYEEKEAP